MNLPPLTVNGRVPCDRTALLGGGARRGFTLVELMIAMTILGLVIGIALVAFVAVIKRAAHTEAAIKGSAELRAATDYISQMVRSSSQEPIVSTNGLSLTVAPEDLGFATVEDGAWLDQPNNVKGSKSSQAVLKLSNVVKSAVLYSVYTSTSRPAGAVSASQVSTYFVTNSANFPVVNLNDVFLVGSKIEIPATAYGVAAEGVINNINNGSGSKALTLSKNIGVDVPNGTRILATAGRRMQFTVVATGAAAGDLRYYPDNRDLTKFTVLAHDIDPSPLLVPSETSSGNGLPFSTTARYVTMNLQKVPKGTTAGRTVQGAQTTVLARTDPAVR